MNYVKVLIAEDDSIINEMLTYDVQKYFGQDHCEVHSVFTTKEALEKISNNIYDFVISDYHLSDSKSDEVIKLTHKVKLPCICISGDQIEKNQYTNEELCLEKPFRTKDLQRVIKLALKQNTLIQ